LRSEPRGLREAFVDTGLAARRRDLPRVAYVWSRSNGILARSLGRSGWLLLPLIWPYWLLLAARLRHAAVITPHAVAVVRNPDGKVTVDPAALAGAMATWLVTWIVYLAVLGTVLPPAGYIAVVALLLVTVIVDGAAEFAWVRWRTRGQQARSLTAQTIDLGAASLVMVAAYPRRDGAGTTLMDAINAVLDQRGQPAVLDARTSELTDFYERAGYAPLGAGRRMVRKPT
jgi:hypothetical protein